jgi:uncharacterized protein (DUF2132 family)
MCFSPQKLKNQKEYYKLLYNKKIKEIVNKAPMHLVPNNELISRNYDKIKRIKKTFIENNYNNNSKIGSLFKNNLKILNSSCTNKIQTKNLSINISNYKNKENNLISSYSFRKKILIPFNNANNKDTKYFNNINHSNNTQMKNELSNLNIINESNNNKSSLNIKNVSIIAPNKSNNNENQNNSCIIISQKEPKMKKNSISTRNNINKINNFKKIAKYPLSPHILNINSLLLNSTKQKSICFSNNPSINSSLSYIKSNMNNLSDRVELKKEIENIIPEGKQCNFSKSVNKKIVDNNLLNNKLKMSFFNFINKSKDKRNESLKLFNQIYDKLANKGYNNKKPLFKIKSKKSSGNLKMYDDYNYKGDLIRNNDVITSGSLHSSFQEEEVDNCSEEIHFKAVTYFQEIKKNKESYN